MITSLVLFFISGAMALVIRAQLANPSSSLVNFQTYNELFTMHGSLMLYLFAGPFAFGGLANYIVPLQVGAPDMAFPRLNALSYWLYLGGSLTMTLELLDGRRRRRLRLGRLCAALQLDQLARGRHRHVDHVAGPDRVLGHLHRRQPGDHHLLPAGAGHDDVPGADLHLEHAGHRYPDPDRLPGADRRRRPALLRPALRHPYLRGTGRWCHRCSSRTSSGSSGTPRSTSSRYRTSAS